MPSYTQTVMLVDTQLDELGRQKSLNRLQDEPMNSFRDRVYLSGLNPPRPVLDYYNFSVNNNLGLFQKKILKIELDENLIDEDDLPRIEIESNMLKVWENQSQDPVLEIYFNDPNYKFVKDVIAALQTLNFLVVTSLDSDDYDYSRNIQKSSSDSYRSEFLLRKSKMQKLGVKYIDFFNTNNPILMQNEEANADSLTEDGDYFLDKTNGILYTYGENAGVASFGFQSFPFYMIYNPANILELSDESMNEIIYDNVIMEDETTSRLRLNSQGAQYINQILEDNRMYWGI